MEPVNETLVDEASKASPGNPMYAGGIAVLVAFVLFMYWGSLNERDESKDAPEGKSKTSKIVSHSVHEKVTSRKKRKMKGVKKKRDRSAVYSVSNAMSKHLLQDAGNARDRTCACCEQCRLEEYEMQNERTSQSMYGAHLLSKSTQTSLFSSANKFYQDRGRLGVRPYSSFRTRDVAREPQRRRAYSSPDILPPLTGFPTCTCVLQFQNGASHDPASLLTAQTSIPPFPLLPNPATHNWSDVATSQSILRCEDVELDFGHDGETRGCVLNLEIPQNSAAGHVDHDGATSLTDRTLEKSPNGEGSAGIPRSLGGNGDSARNSNGKTFRQLDDAFVRLEEHPDVMITILAESVM